MKRLAFALLKTLRRHTITAQTEDFMSYNLKQIVETAFQLSTHFFQRNDKYGTEKAIVRTLAALCLRQKVYSSKPYAESFLRLSLKETLNRNQFRSSLDSSPFSNVLKRLTTLYVASTEYEIKEMTANQNVLEAAVLAAESMIKNGTINLKQDEKIVNVLKAGQALDEGNKSLMTSFLYAPLQNRYAAYLCEYFVLISVLETHVTESNLRDYADFIQEIENPRRDREAQHVLIAELQKVSNFAKNSLRYVFFTEVETRKTSFKIWRQHCLQLISCASVFDLAKYHDAASKSNVIDLRRTPIRTKQLKWLTLFQIVPTIAEPENFALTLHSNEITGRIKTSEIMRFSISCSLICKNSKVLADKYIPLFFARHEVKIDPSMQSEFEATVKVGGSLHKVEFKQFMTITLDKNAWKLQIENVDGNTILIVACAAALMAEIGFHCFDKNTLVTTEVTGKQWKYLFALGFLPKDENWLYEEQRKDEIQAKIATAAKRYDNLSEMIQLQCPYHKFVLSYTAFFPVFYYE